MSQNDITGDRLVSKANSKDYEDNFDRIFNKTSKDLGRSAEDIADTLVGHKDGAENCTEKK
jgi:hypothetical protein